jgi:uncharacterized RDD family membrane protein YckC
VNVAQLNLSAAAVPAADAVVPGIVTVGFGKRTAARIVDLILHIGVSAVTGAVIGVAVVIIASLNGSPVDPILERMARTGVAGKVFGILGFILYSAICDGLFGATAGKYLLGMVVLSEEDGGRCTYVQAIARSFAFVIDSFFFGIVAYLSMKDSPKDQRHGDKWAGTVVATRASAPAGVLRGPLYFVGVLLLAMCLDGIAVSIGILL